MKKLIVSIEIKSDTSYTRVDYLPDILVELANQIKEKGLPVRGKAIRTFGVRDMNGVTYGELTLL